MQPTSLRCLALSACLAATAIAFAAPVTDVDSYGWCNILIVRGAGTGNTWGEPFFLQGAGRTTAEWSAAFHTIQWDNDRRVFIYYTSRTQVLYHGIVQPGGDVIWHQGPPPGTRGGSQKQPGALPVPTATCASRFREEDQTHCENILVHHSGSTDVNRLYIRQSPSPAYGIYHSVRDRHKPTFALNFTRSRVELTQVRQLNPYMYYTSNRAVFPVSSVTLQKARFGRDPAPLLSCVELAPIPTPPPLGGAGTRPLVGGRSAAGLAKPEEFVYFSYLPPVSSISNFEIRVTALGGGGGPDGFWFLALDDVAMPTLEGFRWSGEKCVSVRQQELTNPKATIFIGVYKFGGPNTPFTIRVVENPVESMC